MTGYKAYQGNQVEGSGPLGLILLTYEAMAKSLARAHRAIEAGDLAAEADHTSRAMEAIIELSNSLNMEAGGEVAKNLAAVYAYIFKRLSEGMCSSSTSHIKECIQLVQTLRDGWQQLANEQKRSASQAASGARQAAEHREPVQVTSYAA